MHVDVDKLTPLGRFVYDEMTTRNMEVAEFAGEVGVSTMAIYRMLKGSTPRMPTLSSLARYTKQDIGTITGLLAPHATYDLSTRVQIISGNIEKLPTEKIDEIDALIKFWLSQQDQQPFKGRKTRRRKM